MHSVRAGLIVLLLSTVGLNAVGCRSVARFTATPSPATPSLRATADTEALPKIQASGRAAERVLSVEEGFASYYAAEFQGRRTSSGEVFDAEALTAAHQSLAFGTRVRVTNQTNQKSVIVRINDRLPPNCKGRIIDLSPAAARQIDMIQAGVVRVKIEVLAN